MEESLNILYVDPSNERRDYCKKTLSNLPIESDVDAIDGKSERFNPDSYNMIVVFYTEMRLIRENVTQTKYDGEIILVIDDDADRRITELNNKYVDDIVKITSIDDIELLRQRIERKNAYKRSKKRLYEINESISKLFNSNDMEEIANTTVKSAKNIMGYKFVGLHVKEENKLIPIETTKKVKQVIGEREIPKKEGIAWNAFNKKEIKVYNDTNKNNKTDKERKIKTEIAVPIGENWLLLVGSEKKNDFSPNDIAGLNILRKNTRKAIHRLQRKNFIKRFKFFVELSPDIVQVVNKDKIVTYQSPESPLTTFKMPNIENKQVTEFPVANDKEKIENEIEKTMSDTDKIITTKYKVKDQNTGEKIWVETRTQNFIDTQPVNGIIRVTREITEEKERKEAIKEKNNQLDQFASVVTHDLRNPLAVAQGNIDLIENRLETDNEEIFEYANDVDSSLNRMENIIQNMLSLTKSGEITGEKQVKNIDSIISDAWENVEAKEATIEVNTEKKVNCDDEALIQCFENLFRNSIEHGGKDVKITIEEIRGGVCIKDNGSGISEDIADTLFEMGETTEKTGTGYGLGIVKQIVDEHDWEIEIDTKHTGAKFDIFPKEADKIESQNHNKNNSDTNNTSNKNENKHSDYPDNNNHNNEPNNETKHDKENTNNSDRKDSKLTDYK